MVEWTIESSKRYADPFNDVEVDVVFSRGGHSWRVPTFWSGGQRWTVRFAPPAPGVYSFRLESTDSSNPDLNGRAGRVEITAYSGSNVLLQRGPLRVSSNKRYFEHADGTPFYWLGDTWWTGLSDRISWEGFQRLTADRKSKGFTLVQIVAGLVPLEEAGEAGFCNEGGCVWNAGFTQINPQYFDHAERRIQLLVSSDIVPAIVGGWSSILAKIGAEKMKKHWRYIIARFGAYPVVWIVGGEALDLPEGKRIAGYEPSSKIPRGAWTAIAKYVRESDPYRHPLTVHEIPPPLDHPIQDESLTDFDLFQSGQGGTSSIAYGVAQIDTHYARSSVTKPVVQGEIGYEGHHNRHYEDYQRTAFWLSMLNGAAGHTYGADATWGAYSADKPLPKTLLSFLHWDEGMDLPGSYQVGLASRLLRRYEWWRFQPHPEWISPRGTTYFEPQDSAALSEWALWSVKNRSEPEPGYFLLEPATEEETRRFGIFDQPYAAGIPRQIRVVYIPIRRHAATAPPLPPTVMGLEEGVCYTTYLWAPQFGIRIDLGAVQRPPSAAPSFHDQFESTSHDARAWVYAKGKPAFGHGKLTANDELLATLRDVSESDVVIEVTAQADADAALIARYRDADNYLVATHSAADKTIFLTERRAGVTGRPFGTAPVPLLAGQIHLSMETRKGVAAASVTDGRHTYTTRIVSLSSVDAGSVGVWHQAQGKGAAQTFDDFTLRRSPTLVEDSSLPTKLYDARGGYRGDLSEGGSWLSLQKEKHILLDAYRPDRLPTGGDWVLVLDATNGAGEVRGSTEQTAIR